MEYIDITSTADSIRLTMPNYDYTADTWARAWNTLSTTWTGSFNYSFTPTLEWILKMEESMFCRTERALLNRFYNLSFCRIPHDSLTDDEIIERTNKMLRIWLYNLTRRSIIPAGMYAEDFIRILDDIDGYSQEVYENDNGDLCARYLSNQPKWEAYRKEALEAGVDYQIEAYLDGTPFEMIEANWEVV